MAQWLRALSALPRDPDLIPSTYMAAHNICNLTVIQGDLLSPSGLHWDQADKWQTDICRQKVHTHKIDKNK